MKVILVGTVRANVVEELPGKYQVLAFSNVADGSTGK